MFSFRPYSYCSGLCFPHYNCNTIASPFLSKLCLCLVIFLISQGCLAVLQKLSKMLLNNKFSKPWHCKQAAEQGSNFIQTAATQSTKSRSLHQTRVLLAIRDQKILLHVHHEARGIDSPSSWWDWESWWDFVGGGSLTSGQTLSVEGDHWSRSQPTSTFLLRFFCLPNSWNGLFTVRTLSCCNCSGCNRANRINTIAFLCYLLGSLDP